jgi:Domain of unknown function (DUF4153)
MGSSWARGAWRRLPVESICVLSVAVCLSAMNHGARSVWFGRVALAAVLLAPLAVAAHRLARRTQLVLGVVAASALLAAVAAAVPDAEAIGRPSFGWPYGLALLAAALVPFIAAAPRFTPFVRRFCEQTTVWLVLGGCALAAYGVVVFSLRQLFDLRIETIAYDGALALVSVIVLLYLDRLVHAGDDSGRIPEIWRRLATVIGAPFVSVMLVVLVSYEVFVLCSGDLPRNVLSPLILAAGFVGFLTSLILASMTDERVGTAALTQADPHIFARHRSARLARAFPLVLLALLPLAGWALLARVEQHGLTPFRVVRLYGLACLAVLSIIGIARWLRGRALGWEVPATMLAFALLAAFGPLSAVSLSLDSQSRLVARGLRAAGASPFVRAESGVTTIIDEASYRELSDGIEELARIDGERGLRRVLSGDVAACSERWKIAGCLGQLGLEPDRLSAPRTTVLESHVPVVTSSGLVAVFDLYAGAQHGDLELRDNRVVAYHEGRALGSASLLGLVPDAGDALSRSAVPVVADDGSVLGELAIQRLDVVRRGSAPFEIPHIVGVWLPRRR